MPERLITMDRDCDRSCAWIVSADAETAIPSPAAAISFIMVLLGS
jgi:hypothetical protein